MSDDRPHRSIQRFDYKIYNNTGVKVVKDQKIGISVMATNIDKELKMARKLSRFMTEFELELLYEVGDIEGGIAELREILEEYEDVHIALKREQGDDAYVKNYPDFDSQIKIATDWIKNAKLEIKKQKVERSRMLENENLDQIRREKDKLSAEEKYFSQRIKSEIENMESENSIFIEDLEKNVSLAQELAKGIADIFVKIEALGVEFRKEFGSTYEDQSFLINEFIKNTKKKVQEIKLCKLHDEKERERSVKIDLIEREKRDKVSLCKNIFENISERFSTLENKCSIPVLNLSDSELLDKKREFKTIESDFNEILDRITKLGEVNPNEFVETKDLLKITGDRKIKLKTSMDLFRTSLDHEIKKRDLSEEKIKNASILEIQLPKFKGYTSTMDFYTFKSEFEKLVAPRIRAMLLPEYLKRNYLEGQAFEIVKEIDDINEIWARLKLSYGNVVTLLSNKLKEIESGQVLWQIKSDEKLVQSIIKVKNCMMELSSLAKKHGIETSLFHTSNLAKIFHILGRKRQMDITKKILELEYSDQQTWDEIIKYLDKELKVKEHMSLFGIPKSDPKMASSKLSREKDNSQNYNMDVSKNKKCVLCGRTDHVPTITSKGNSIINYFACDKFAKMSPKNRLEELRRKKLCFQCLTPGFKVRHEGDCFNKFKCPHESHRRYASGLHVLICEKHKNDRENLELLQSYKTKYITNSDSSHLDFSRNIGISFHVGGGTCDSYTLGEVEGEEDSEMAIYMFQTINVGNKKLNLFFDTGCTDLVCKKGAVDMLIEQKRAKQIVKGPIILSGVGDKKSVCEHGRYHIIVPLYDGKNVNLSGICLDKVTGTFPSYPLKQVEEDIHRAWCASGEDPNVLPKLPKMVGGDTDLMIGIKYLKYYPKYIFSLSNGLSIYESPFMGSDGSRGIIGGPHRAFTEVHRSLGSNHISAYLEQLTQIYNSSCKLSLDASLLGMKEDKLLYGKNEIMFDDSDTPLNNCGGESVDELVDDLKMVKNEVYLAKRPPKNYIKFEEIESLGTDVTYRCARCRGCENCLRDGNIECISTQEEVEQAIIDKSVKVNLEQNCTSALLPFLCDPVTKLAPNSKIALKVYQRQVKGLSKNEKDKEDVLKAEKKLHDLGFVDYVHNLSKDEQKKIFSGPMMHCLPWFAVWNENSISSKCRPVFNASQPTSTGLSLNDILAKGRNNMNKLQEIVIRWLIWQCAYHTDVKNMYNRVLLEPEHWCYQLYYFQNELDPNKEPMIKVIKTLIYGVKSSGNQAERGIRETANLQKTEYPRQYEVICKDIYVDDCLSGEESFEVAREVTDGSEIVLNKGGFMTKGITFSGFDPPENLSNEDKSVNVAGMKWFSKLDLLSLNLSELNFSKKYRGKKSRNLNGILPEQFTRRDCAGRAAEVFDLLGRFTPIIAGIKLDLSELSLRGLNWDDVIPTDLVSIWKDNFETISKLGEIKFKRAIVPEDAVNLDMEILAMSDSSPSLACSVIYARFMRKNGLYSCQIVFARSKVIPKGMTIPRAELYAAVLGASAQHVVSTALEKFVKNRINLTDSQIVLFWINNSKLQLKQWARNRVIEINRLSNRGDWYYIDSKNNNADLGTRKGAKLADVMDGSVWVNGHDWAKYDKTLFPIKSFDELTLSNEELKVHDDEILKSETIDEDWINKQLSVMYNQFYQVLEKGILNDIGERYLFSRYIIDPNRFRLRKVVRIVALVILFVKNVKKRINKAENVIMFENELPAQLKLQNDTYLVTQGTSQFPFNCQEGLVVSLSEQSVKSGLNYFYTKASLEVKHFQKKNSYKSIAKEKNGILYYTGRILPSQKINNKLNLSDACIDLTMASFCVPVVDKYSPLAYALVNEVHWYNDNAKHSGNETVMRYIQTIAHIIEGRVLVRQFRNECPRCLYLQKRAIDVAMGPIPSDNLCIAPAFYVCQVDMFGPYNSYSYVNKRATSKIWFVIFCCCITGAVDIKVCEDYSTNSFILAFIRFSCKVGFPKKLLPDAGSQLVKGCQSMKITFSDIHSQLHEYGVIYEICPVGAHYMHGRVERKIRHVKESFAKNLYNNRLSIIQWETLGTQVANTINNLPIAIGNITKDLENIDLITPNRLLLARNNDRCPVGTVTVSEDVEKIIQRNNDIFSVWFKAWLVSYVPSLMLQPKWFQSDRDPKVGDVVLFLKSDKEFDKQYQFGMICDLKISRDHKIRQIQIEYQNHTEKVKRRTMRGSREIIVIHPVDELGLIRELNVLSADLPLGT